MQDFESLLVLMASPVSFLIFISFESFEAVANTSFCNKTRDLIVSVLNVDDNCPLEIHGRPLDRRRHGYQLDLHN